MLLLLYQENQDAISKSQKPPYTLIIVTHELNEAIRVGDRLVGLSQYWNWEEAGHDSPPGATVVYDKPSPIFKPNERPDYESFENIRREIRSYVYNPDILQSRNEYLMTKLV